MTQVSSWVILCMANLDGSLLGFLCVFLSFVEAFIDFAINYDEHFTGRHTIEKVKVTTFTLLSPFPLGRGARTYGARLML